MKETEERPQDRFIIESLDKLPDPCQTTKWLVPGLLVEGGLNFITAYPGHGKSLVSLDLAHACTHGRKFLGAFDAPQCKVLYIDQDANSDRELNKRVLDFGFSQGSALYRMNQQGLRLDVRDDVIWLRDACVERGIGLVIIDAMVRMHRLDEGKPADMAVIRENLQLVTKEGITVLMIHHNSRRMTFRGSSEIIAMADAMINLKKAKSGKTFTLEITKERTEFEANWNKIEIKPLKIDGVTVLSGRPYYASDDDEEEMEQEILDFCLEDSKTKPEIRSHVTGDVKKIDAAINSLLARGHLTMEKHGAKKLYMTADPGDAESEDVVD